ncbi:hypothetical protein PVAP13_1NG473138 [Panicum virgatum]|uniref:Uncharacterized protein n=1 Tax=Panicum virgatum TaxID=38727 RepID=A0A8T0XFU5_PANVG|nr:hypothetical protein PVAP13_1NG473138 [Panicum virgatum]
MVQLPDGQGGRHRRRRHHARLAPTGVALPCRARLPAGAPVRSRRVQVRQRGAAQVADRGIPWQGRQGHRRHRHQPPHRGAPGRPRHLQHVRGRHARLPPRLGPAHNLQRRPDLLRRHGQPRHRRGHRRCAGHRPPQHAHPAGAHRLAQLAQDGHRLQRLAPRLRQGLLRRRRQDLHRQHRAQPCRRGDLDLAGVRR